MSRPAPSPSRATRRRLSRARAVRRAAGGRCQVMTRRRLCGSVSSGVALVDGVPVAACPAHLPTRTDRPGHAPAARDRDRWTRDLLAKLRRERETSDDSE
ncbi:hypothetical protein Nm8I071_66430 [Nonomuraea sp. TT08I-71]|nr:hypothetical protein Nm8I071_66430 [Nonomuraea sp. TT08I-71]